MEGDSLLWKGLWKEGSMATIEQRLAKLEAAMRARCPVDDSQQVAMRRLLSVLREALPDDQPRFGEPGFSGLSEYRRHADKVQALADRVAAGELGDEDRLLLESLPHDALEYLDMTAPALVTMLARVEAMC